MERVDLEPEGGEGFPTVLTTKLPYSTSIN
jgi:hypothetical protein